MNILLWLDDSRDPHYYAPSFEGSIVWVKSYQEFASWIHTNGLPSKISFDYGLGDVEYDGISCVKSVIRYCVDNTKLFPRFAIHSEHPQVYKLREYLVRSIKRYNLGENIEEDRKPDTEDQKIANENRNTSHDPFGKRMAFQGLEKVSNELNQLKQSLQPVYEKREKQIPIISTKVSRNADCPCGSGKKYKRCCL